MPNSVPHARLHATSETKLAGYIRERDEALEQQAATAEILKIISRSTFDLRTVLDTLTKRAVELCAADGGIISMQDGDLYWIRSVYGFSREAQRYAFQNPLRRDRGGVTGRVALLGKAVHIPDVLADPEYTAFEYQKLMGQRTNLGVPLLCGGATIGVFSLTRTRVDPFTDKQIDLVSTFADQAVIAIENTRLLSELQAELVHANRVATMGQFTASIAHEIKQPIATARNNARAALNFLDKNPPDLTEVRDGLTCIVNDADRANDVVDRIGSLIKKTPARKEVVDFNAAILEVTALIHNEAVKTGVTVSTQLMGKLPRIQCDRVQLQQVMLNLIVNAIQSMSGVEDGNRELLISTVSIEPLGVRVAVRDTGHGLRSESLPRLFEPFYTTKPDGMGMGLSICRSIIEAHGGQLWAIKCEPRGALFQFTLPAD